MPLVFSDGCCGSGICATLTQGESVSNQIAFTSDGTTALNLTGYAIKMRINFPTPLDLNTTNGGITITNAVGGLARINIADTVTEEFEIGTFPYDLFTISGSGQSICWFSGDFVVQAGITPIP